MIEEGSMVAPGDELAMAEELMAGEGTYQDKGIIRSSIIGKFRIDKKKLEAIVEPLPSMPLILKGGDVVICEVKQVMDAMVIVEILHVAGKNREIAGERDGAIHVSNISDEYVSHPNTKYRIGDVIRAKVIRVDPLTQLSTKGNEFGVIKAFCTNCRNPLIKEGNSLKCPVCGKKEERKIADDYGMGNIDRVINNEN